MYFNVMAWQRIENGDGKEIRSSILDCYHIFALCKTIASRLILLAIDARSRYYALPTQTHTDANVAPTFVPATPYTKFHTHTHTPNAIKSYLNSTIYGSMWNNVITRRIKTGY